MDEKVKTLLRELGLKEDDFDVFDGTNVRWEYDEKKGVRIYDPDYRTSYDEYIEVEGWSAWSSEKDTFMKDILKGVTGADPREADLEERQRVITESLRKKFSKGASKKSE